MSAVDHFGSIIANFENDIQPSEEEWRATFNCTGYKALRNDEDIRYNIELVFLPKR